jgi:hypothetical protein
MSAEEILIVLAILFVVACAIDLLNVLKSSHLDNKNLIIPQLVQIRASNSMQVSVSQIQFDRGLNRNTPHHGALNYEERL